MLSTPGVALDVITGNIPITLWLEEESTKGALRLKNLNHWQHPPSWKLSMRLTSHITTKEKLLKARRGGGGGKHHFFRAAVTELLKTNK